MPHTPEELKEKLGFIPRTAESRTEFKDLPTWVRSAIAMHELVGLSWADACKRCGKSAAAMKEYQKSPALQAWTEELREYATDPKFMAEKVLEASVLGVTLDYLGAYEKAVESGDYNAISKMSQDLLDRFGIVRKKDQGKPESLKIELVLGGGGMAMLEPPKVTATHEEIPEVDYEVVEK